MHMSGLPGAVLPDHPVDHRYYAGPAGGGVGDDPRGGHHLLAELPLKFHPGTRFNYGLSTDICGRLVEMLSGQPFDEYVDESVTGPAGDGGHRILRCPGMPARRLAACYLHATGAPADAPRRPGHQ